MQSSQNMDSETSVQTHVNPYQRHRNIAVKKINNILYVQSKDLFF